MLSTDKMIKGIRNPRKIPRHIKGQVADWYFNFDSKQTNIYERDWDVLIILDGCRVDSLEEVSDEYSFLPDEILHITSVGGGSPDWLGNTFTDEWVDDIENTGYITANPHTRRVLSASNKGLFSEQGEPGNQLAYFDYFIPVWEMNWDDELGTVPPQAVTDHLIRNHRDRPDTRAIAHYMQPHFPSIPDPVGSGMNIDDEARWESDDTWTLVRNGDVTVEEAYQSYLNNLRYVLDNIEKVLSNIDAESVIITADHGNAFGELGEYSHGQSYLGCVRNVPWVETSARNTENYSPDIDDTESSEVRNTSVEEKLQALGYKT